MPDTANGSPIAGSAGRYGPISRVALASQDNGSGKLGWYNPAESLPTL